MLYVQPCYQLTVLDAFLVDKNIFSKGEFEMKKKILLIGGMEKAKVLGKSLVNKGFKVTIINKDYDDCMELARLKGVSVINGDGTKPCILDEAGVEDCDFSICLSSKDEDNLTASEICKKKYNVPKTVSLLSDPSKKDFFYTMGIDSVVSATQTVTNIIEQQAFVDQMTNIIPIGTGQAQIMEVALRSDSPVEGMKIKEITFPKGAIIGCIMRGSKTIIPGGDTELYKDDVLVIIADSSNEKEVLNKIVGR